MYLVKCDECGASGAAIKTLYQPITELDGDNYDAEAIAAAASWNTRVALAQNINGG